MSSKFLSSDSRELYLLNFISVLFFYLGILNDWLSRDNLPYWYVSSVFFLRERYILFLHISINGFPPIFILHFYVAQSNNHLMI